MSRRLATLLAAATKGVARLALAGWAGATLLDAGPAHAIG